MADSKWLIIEDDESVHVVPLFDIKPHGHGKPGARVVVLESVHCPCKPTIEIGDASGMFRKPLIGHHSFHDQQRIAESVAKICA